MSAQSAGERPSLYSWYVLGVLFVVYCFNFIDRQILAIVIDDIKAEIEVSDTALGFLLGFAFVMFYTSAGLPIARLADRGSRRSIIAAGLALWSGMTALSGLASNFWQLALARFGVGIGEAAGTPPSHSLISDYFPPHRRATALSCYAMGIYVGVMFGFLAGGAIRDAFDWRMAFLLVGLPGLPLALLVRFTVREPVRGASESGPVDGNTPELGEVVRTLFAQRTFVLLTLGACLQALSGYAVLSWGPAFLFRVHHMTGMEVGTSFGLIAGIGGATGSILGGLLADRFATRDARYTLWLPALLTLAAAPFALPFYLADDPALALAAFVPFYVLGNTYVGPLWSVAQSLVKVRMRALASATLLTVLNLVGLGAGPLLVGFLNDRLRASHGDEAIRFSLLAMALVGALGSIFFWMAARTLRQDLGQTGPSEEPR